MLTLISDSARSRIQRGEFRQLPMLLAPLPLPVLQPALNRIMQHMLARYPALFARLGPHQHSRFCIDPTNLPFVFLLEPDSRAPRLRVFRRHQHVEADARISGSLLNLLDLIDGRLDGDALFFSRELIVEGNTEAIVCLRNALDDVDGNAVDDIVNALVLFRRPMQRALAFVRATRTGETHTGAVYTGAAYTGEPYGG